jgi:hypothetical protein
VNLLHFGDQRDVAAQEFGRIGYSDTNSDGTLGFLLGGVISDTRTRTSEYSIDPVWSPDGRFLVYSGADVGTTFPLRAAADGRPYPLPSVLLTRGARRVAFFRDPQALVISRR